MRYDSWGYMYMYLHELLYFTTTIKVGSVQPAMLGRSVGPLRGAKTTAAPTTGVCASALTPTSTGRRVCRAWHAWRASTTASRLCRDSHSVGDTAPGTPAGLPSVQRDANTPDVSASTPRGSDTSTGFLCCLFSAASRAHHDLKGAMADNSLEHELLALANTD